MRKILLSFITIVAVSVAVVKGTQALFSDTETSAGNSFAAGKLDLELEEEAPLPFSVSDVVPGQSGTGKVTLTNVAGSIPGQLSISWTKTIDDDNDLIEPEINPGYGTADYDGNGGELDMFLQFAPFIDVNQDGVFNSGDIQLAYNGQATAYPGYRSGDLYYSGLNSYLTTWSNVMTLNGDESVDVVVPWQMPTESQDTNYSINISMTDSLGFDAEFALNQIP